MSHASHHGPADASGGHDHHHFDGIPADEAAPDEPRTPGWLTLLGVGLVLSVLLAAALVRPDDKTRAQLTPNTNAGTAASAAAPTPAPSAAPRAVRPPMPGNPAGLPSGFPMPRLAMSGVRAVPRPPGGANPGAVPPRPQAAPSPAPTAPAH
jgi:hypothetical protein